MMPVPITPLDGWIKRCLGFAVQDHTWRLDLQRFQLERIRRTLAHAAAHSPFYRRRLAGHADLARIDCKAFATLPFTTARDLRRDPLQFLCTSHSRIARVVTLRSSGTTAEPKRLFFDRADLERTVDFFRHGMSALVQAGQRVLILMPGQTPGSVGDLLAKALERMDVRGIVYGPVSDPEDAIDQILDHRAHCLVGIPVQVLSLVRHLKAARIPPGLIRSVLLSTDYVPASVVADIERSWGCSVYQHYGMTEMGYGGGVECDAHNGYHLREADLFVEIVDPISGRPLPAGVTGEVVFTTLSRRTMPLIRYRTGDMARFLTGLCPCGSILPRLGKIEGRITNGADLSPHVRLHMAMLDEALFAIPEILDFQAELVPDKGRVRLNLTICCDPYRFPSTVRDVRKALCGLPVVHEAINQGALALGPIRLTPEKWFTTGAAKRTLNDQRQETLPS